MRSDACGASAVLPEQRAPYHCSKVHSLAKQSQFVIKITFTNIVLCLFTALTSIIELSPELRRPAVCCACASWIWLLEKTVASACRALRPVWHAKRRGRAQKRRLLQYLGRGDCQRGDGAVVLHPAAASACCGAPHVFYAGQTSKASAVCPSRSDRHSVSSCSNLFKSNHTSLPGVTRTRACAPMTKTCRLRA